MLNLFCAHNPGRIKKRLVIVIAGLIVSLFFLQTRRAAALPIFTADGTNCTLEDAIAEINSAGALATTCDAEYVAGADEIDLTYDPTFTVAYTGFNNATPTVTSTIIIRGNGHTITRAGANEFRYFFVDGAGNLTVENLTMSDSFFNTGSAIRNEATLTVNNVTFTNNQAVPTIIFGAAGLDGGAIYNFGGTATINDSTFDGNHADELGGAIFNAPDGGGNLATLTVNNSTFVNNTADQGGGAIQQNNVPSTSTISNSSFSNNSTAGNAGAVQNGNGSMDIIDTTFTNNSADDSGGAIYNVIGTLSVLRGTFTGNTAASLGGAIRNDNVLTLTDSTLNSNSAAVGGGLHQQDFAGFAADGTITGTTFNGNTASNAGGGLQVSSSTMDISSSTFNNNSATNSGGGLYIGAPAGDITLTLTNSTVSGNSAPAGASIYQEFGTAADSTLTNVTITLNNGGGLEIEAGSSMTVTNSIVANQQGGGADCVSALTSNGYNLESAATCGFTDPNDLQNTNALLAGLASNGGSTQTHALLAGSPAIDFANAAVCAAAPVNNVDQRGSARGIDRVTDPAEPGGDCDIGAFELQAAPPPTPSSGGGSGGDQFDWDLTIDGDGVVVDPVTVNWTFTVCNVGGTNLPGVWPLFLFDPAPGSATHTPGATLDGDESKVNLGPMSRDECKQVFIQAEYTSGLADPLVCIKGSVPGAADRPCVSLTDEAVPAFPAELPSTGGQPVADIREVAALVLLLIGATVGTMILRGRAGGLKPGSSQR